MQMPPRIMAMIAKAVYAEEILYMFEMLKHVGIGGMLSMRTAAFANA